MLTNDEGRAETMGGQHIRRIGRWAACVAAYVLVLNVMLTSALVASISPVQFNALHQLCLNGISAGQPADKSDPGKPIVKCPLCLSSAAALADVPPQSPALAIRVALHVPFEIAEHDVLVVRPASSDHQPRGPPHLS